MYSFTNFLNQVRRPAHTWFLKIDPALIVGMRVCVCVCVYLSPKLLTSGMVWIPCDYLNKFYSCYMATVAVIVNVRGLGIDTHHGS